MSTRIESDALNHARDALVNAERLVASLNALELAADEDIIRSATRELGVEAKIIVRRMRNICKWVESAA